MGQNDVSWQVLSHLGRKTPSKRLPWLQCPFHGFEYDATGRVTVIPANGKKQPVPKRFRVTAYPTHEAHGFIWIWWGEDPPADLAPPRFFDDLGESFSYGKAADPWPCHYSRAVENQLDVAHLPFVHHNTIGRGNRTLVEGPVVEWVDPNRFYIYVYNQVDDGRLPRKPREIKPRPGLDFRLGFLFPNLWQNYLGNDNRILAAFAPVDEANTVIYLRFYQRFLRVPLLRNLVNWLAMPFNMRILHQDRDVAITEPQRSHLKIGEPLIQADGPIIAYRRRRQELIDATREGLPLS